VDPNAADRVSSPYSGTVASLAANKLSVRAEKTKSRLSAVPTRRSISFTIPESVTITRNGQPCTVKDIKPGDSVSVSFDCKKGSSIRKVTAVEVGSASSGQ
jgi:hypothetical protein